jgi:hypothetical protein
MHPVELLKGLIRLGIFARRLNRKLLGHRFVFRILCKTLPCSHPVSARLSIVQDCVSPSASLRARFQTEFHLFIPSVLNLS